VATTGPLACRAPADGRRPPPAYGMRSSLAVRAPKGLVTRTK